MTQMSPNQIHRVRSALNAIDKVLAEVDPKPDGSGAAVGRSGVPEPRTETDLRRQWEFLHGLEVAGGSVSAPELSKLGRESGYRSGRALNGFYRGHSALLRKSEDRRELTDQGREFVRRYERLFGGGSR